MKALLVLAPREVQVLGLVADGLPDHAIGKRLGVSPETVGTLLARAMKRMGVTHRAGAVGVCYREGFLVRRPVSVRVPQMSAQTAWALELATAGRSNREIGLSLGIGEAAAGSRVRWLLRAFGAVSRANLVKVVIDAGVVTPDLKLRNAAREPVAAPQAPGAPLEAAQRAAGVIAQPAPQIPPGGLLDALLTALGPKRGDEIPAEDLDGLILAGIADGRGRAETFTALEIRTSTGRKRLEQLSKDWGVRGGILLTAEAYRRGALEPAPADPVALTASESNLLALIVSCGSYLRVARLTGRKPDTVSGHAGRLLRVLGARNAAHAVKRGVDIGALALAPMAAAA